MKKHLLTVIFYISFITGSFAQINIQWQTRYTSSGSNVDKAEDMVMDAAGNVYVTGLGIGTSTNFDYITIKYNAAGAQQWIAQYNGPGNGLDEAHAITVDTSGNVYVTGWSNGGATTGYDFATVKYNASGVQQWASRYNNTTNGTDEAWDIAVDYAGNVFITGTSDGSGSNSAAVTIKYNSAGVQQYAKRFNGAGNGIDAGFAIYVNPVTGDNYVAGYTYQSATADFDFVTIKYDNTGTQVWASQYDSPADNYDEARAIAVDPAGNVYVTGYTQTAVLTNYDYATVKYNSAGVQQWAKTYNGSGNDYDRANAIKLDAANNVYVTGRSVGVSPDAEDIVTIKYNNAGTQKWLARYNGPTNGYDEGKALVIDAIGNTYVTGYSYTTGVNNDFTTIKYDSTGAQQWITKYNGTGNNSDQSLAVGVDNIGNVFVAGVSKGAGTNDDFETIKYCQLTADAGSDVTICNGANTTLSATAIGAVSYAWLPNDGTLSSVTSATPIANPTTTTAYYVAITNTNGCVDLDTVVVNVVPLPAPGITASGPTTFCIGGSVTLTSNPSTHYQWSTAANDTLASITVNTSGTYMVTVTNANGCAATSTQSVTVVTLPPVDAGLSDSTCLSTNVNLTASGAMTYIWHPGTSLSDSTIFNPVAGPIVTTTYTVIGTASGGCSNIDSVKITVLGNPGVPVFTKQNDTLVCSTPASGYQWYVDGVAITGATSNTYIYTANGNYYVRVYNAQGCSTASTSLGIFDIGIDEISASASLSVYPNPATDDVTLEINLAKASDVKINLMSIAGQLIYTDELSQFMGTYKKQLNLKEQAKGIYYLQVITNDGVLNKKVVKN
ncbi:MAG: hypothetical protein JWP12_940 [Bacteroidetes bacterium]|nr:hypothetical protein [Bacteroidota bacterium]